MNFPQDNFFLKVKDNSVSKEEFELYHDPKLDMLATFPKPGLEELPKYYESDDYISHTDGKRSLFEMAYHFIKNIALKKKVSLINSLSQKGNLLDIGAGTGDFLSVAKTDGWNVVGSEPSERARNVASAKNISLLQSTESLPDHSFDIITMWHVLEHVYDLELQIKELKRLLKPGGSIVIAVPNFNSYDAKHYKEFWAAYDVPRHLWHFSKTSIKELFSRESFDLKKVLPMKFDAFYVALLSEKYKTGKMNFIKASMLGLKSNRYGAKTGEYSSHIYILSAKN
ncbi:MAG: class I SAM-dependent methyltransferase [Flavobacterium sp.]|nr:MAG: class I SAM-dependent methyltransferase [Flavobacterium sp.]